MCVQGQQASNKMSGQLINLRHKNGCRLLSDKTQTKKITYETNNGYIYIVHFGAQALIASASDNVELSRLLQPVM